MNDGLQKGWSAPRNPLDREPPAQGSGGLELVFRFRYWLHVVILGAAFAISAATMRWAGLQRVWLDLPVAAAAHLNLRLHDGIVGVTAVAVLLAVAGAALRNWSSACLGSRVVFDSHLTAAKFVTGGPYRFVRNPLYLGTVLHTLALCVLMSWVAAVFAITAIISLQAALIVSEERFLSQASGPVYAAFKKSVPRIIPRLTPARVQESAEHQWLQATVGEAYMWGVAISFAVFGGTYNAVLILQGVVISFGVSIVLRGLTARR